MPPNVVLSFSYIRGLFVYCPFLLVLFILPLLFLRSIYRRAVSAVHGPDAAAELIEEGGGTGGFGGTGGNGAVAIVGPAFAVIDNAAANDGEDVAVL